MFNLSTYGGTNQQAKAVSLFVKLEKGFVPIVKRFEDLSLWHEQPAFSFLIGSEGRRKEVKKGTV